MATEANHLPVEINISRARGDDFTLTFTIQDGDETAIDITSFSFKLSLDTREEPDDESTQLFKLTGSIIDGPNGKVKFSPSTANMDQDPGEYYYDLEMTDASSKIRTVAKGTWTFGQDITKT